MKHDNFEGPSAPKLGWKHPRWKHLISTEVKAKETPNASEKPTKQNVHETEKASEETKLCTGNERKIEPPKEKLKDIKTMTSNSKKLANHPNNVSKTTHGDKKTNSPPITNDKEKHKIQGVQCAAKDSDQQCKDCV